MNICLDVAEIRVQSAPGAAHEQVAEQCPELTLAVPPAQEQQLGTAPMRNPPPRHQGKAWQSVPALSQSRAVRGCHPITSDVFSKEKKLKSITEKSGFHCSNSSFPMDF